MEALGCRIVRDQDCRPEIQSDMIGYLCKSIHYKLMNTAVWIIFHPLHCVLELMHLVSYMEAYNR